MSIEKLNKIQALKANSAFPFLRIAIPSGFTPSAQFSNYFTHLIEQIAGKNWIILFYDPNSISIEREYYGKQSVAKVNPKTNVVEGYIESQLNTEIKTITLDIIEAYTIVLTTIEDMAIYAIANKKFIEYTIQHVNSQFELVGSLVAPFLDKSCYKSSLNLYNWPAQEAVILESQVYPSPVSLKFIEQVNRFRTITINGVVYSIDPNDYSVLSEGEIPKLEHTFNGLMLTRSYFVTGFQAKLFLGYQEYLDLKELIVNSLVDNSPLSIIDGLNPYGVSTRTGFITEIKPAKGLQNQRTHYKSYPISTDIVSFTEAVEITFMETSYYIV